MPRPPQQIDRFLDFVESYAALGWKVFPCHGVAKDKCTCGRLDCGHPGKHPATDHGFKDSTGDVGRIQAWWSDLPFANIAIATGVISGIVVLDVDPRSGGAESLADLRKLHGELSSTVSALTGGDGQHYYFAHPGGQVISRTFRPGLDLKADGGYVIAPPSTHLSRKRYEWEVGHGPTEIVLAPIPDWLLMESQPPERAGAAEVPGRITAGSRNSSLASLAGTMRRRGMTRDEIASAIHEVNENRCDPPLAAREVDRIADSISRYEPIPFPTLIQRRARQRAKALA
jgi:putative DNA primase/helicase